MAIKKLLDGKRLISETNSSSYRQEFNKISQDLNLVDSLEGWKEIFQKLTYWELQLEISDQNMVEIFHMQKDEANQLYSRFIDRNYEEIIQSNELLSHNLLKAELFPELNNQPYFLIVIDNLRYDQWLMLKPIVEDLYSIESEGIYSSIIPTTTQYARNALFAGLSPLEISKRYAHKWVTEEENEGKNLHEDFFFNENLRRNHLNLKSSYHKITNLNAGKRLVQQIDNLKNNNLVTLDNGALISKQKADPPVLILKSDSTYLYMTTDLATVLDREQNISPDEYLYIVDSRQSEHFKQLFLSVKYFNFSKSNFKHIGFGTINDTEGKPFKTRQGDVYPLEDLWNDIYQILIKKNNKTNAHVLTNSVLVFSDLLIDRSSNYKFDIEKFTNTEGKTAIYIQYTRVRIKSILKNINKIEYFDKFDKTNLTDAEINLILSILKFSDTFKRSKKNNEPHHLAEYLYELCQRFNSFYKESRILDEANIYLQNRRLNILIVCLKIIEISFNILGIETVEEM